MIFISFLGNNKYVLRNVFMFLLITLAYSNNIVANEITYSPDQWPRHWNETINKAQQQNRYYQQNGYDRERPARSPMWGVVPSVKKKPRRSVRPEYNTNAHIINYSGQNIYQRNYYSGPNGYGLADPYVSPLLVPGLMPGLSAPGIPFTTNRYMGNPYMGGVPGPGYMW